MLRRIGSDLIHFRPFGKGGAKGLPWAMLAWWSFVLALLTGAVLAFHYRPWGDVFRSVSHLTGMIPYGRYLRVLHYLSGQAFLVFTLIHVLECFWKERYRTIPAWDWVKLLLIIPLAFLLLLTGFILKGDKEGIFAAGVMFHLAREIPVIGPGLSHIVLRPGDDFFLLPYLHHIAILPVIVLILLVQHRKRFMPRGDLVWLVLAALSLLAIVYPLPADIPPHQARAILAGPWFFQGIQLLLRYAPPFWAGVAWPLLPLVLTAALAFVPASQIGRLRTATALSWAAHGVLMVLAWGLIPRLGG